VDFFYDWGRSTPTPGFCQKSLNSPGHRKIWGVQSNAELNDYATFKVSIMYTFASGKCKQWGCWQNFVNFGRRQKILRGVRRSPSILHKPTCMQETPAIHIIITVSSKFSTNSTQLQNPACAPLTPLIYGLLVLYISMNKRLLIKFVGMPDYMNIRVRYYVSSYVSGYVMIINYTIRNNNRS